MSTNDCMLPDVKFENFAAARSCLQTTLQPKGAVVRELSIQTDQNGKAKWRVTLAATGAFPSPAQHNFVAVRAKLNQCVPHRGVLSTIMLYEAYTQVREELWEVTYSVKKTTRIERAVKRVADCLAKTVPCIKTMPKIRSVLAKADKLTTIQYEKKRAEHFYQLRKAKKFVKGETLKPTVTPPQKTRAVKSTKTINVTPDYDNWDVKAILYSMKNITVEDGKNLVAIESCTDPYNNDLIGPTAYIMQRCPGIKPSQIPRLTQEVLETLGMPKSFVGSLSIKSDFSSRITDTGTSFVQHLLCSH